MRLADRAFAEKELPAFARTALESLIRRLAELTEEICALDHELRARHAEHDASRRLAAIPGIGVITATAITATVTDPDQFRSGRQFAAWLGLTPKQQSTGGRVRLGGISKQGDRYLRRLLVVGATAVLRHCRNKAPPLAQWAQALLEKNLPPRFGRAGQQARPHRLGRPHPQRHLPALRSAATGILRRSISPRIGNGSR